MITAAATTRKFPEKNEDCARMGVGFMVDAGGGGV
jgi:hypothetical protein